MQKGVNKNSFSIIMYAKVAQYSYEFPVTFLPLSYYEYYKTLINCQPSTPIHYQEKMN